MPAQKEEKGVEHPPFDPKKALRQLEELILAQSREVEGSETAARVGTSSIWSILLPVVVLIGIAVYSWYARKNSRELAKLRHEKNKAKILKNKAMLDSELAGGQVKIDEIMKRVEELDEKIRIIDTDIRAEESRHEADVRAIDRMRTWDGSYRSQS